MKNSKIIIIDPQNDFTQLDGSYAKSHPSLSQIQHARHQITQLIAKHDKNDIIVIQSDYYADQFESGLSMCIPGTIGHQIDHDIKSKLLPLVIVKNEHSAFSSPSFLSTLRKAGAETLIICGFLAEYCVKKTALDGLLNDFKIVLVKDAIGTADDVQERKQKMLAELEGVGAIITDSHLLTYA